MVYGQRAEEFSLEVGVEGVQAFFGVRGGGLFRNGSGLVSLPEDGGVYELQKSTLLFLFHLSSHLSSSSD